MITAGQIVALKQILPTSLGSEAIREKYSREILQRSFFSAQTTSASYLARMQEICQAYADGAMNAADARLELLKKLEEGGITPRDDYPGKGMANIAGERRLNLIVKTQGEMAASVARVAQQSDDVLRQYPAWELVRFGTRRKPRQDWAARWQSAGEACGWEGAARGAMVALKASPIWQKLGDGAGGYTDTLGNPYPPFAFSSGMDWQDAPRAQAVKLRLIGEEEEAAKPKAATLSPDDQEIADAAKRLGFTAADFEAEEE